MLTTVGIVVALLFPALEFFGEVSPVDFFTGTDWAPLFEPARFGVLPLMAGTLVVTAVWPRWSAFPSGSARRSTSASTPGRATRRS